MRGTATIAVSERAARMLDQMWSDIPTITSASDLETMRKPLALLATREEVSLLAVAAAMEDIATLVVLGCEQIPAEMPPSDDVVFSSATFEEIAYRATRALRLRRAGIELDAAGMHVGTTHVPLSVAEHRLLTVLLAHPGVPRSREELRAALGDVRDEGRALDAHIYRLRRKLSTLPAVRLETLRQRGFRIVVDERRINSHSSERHSA
jgi:hypothetical protein